MISLPLDSAKWPLFKIQVAGAWATGDASATCSSWTDLPMASGTTKPDRTGMRVLSYSRCLLPQTGTARLAFSYGRFLDKVIGTTAWSAASADNVSDSLAPDLTGSEVRILAAYPSSDPGKDPTYKTVFWGRCEYQLERGHGGADIPSGEMVYHLVDGLDRLKRWVINRHHYNGFDNVDGHPGFNSQTDAIGAIAGDKSTTSNVKTICGAFTPVHSTGPNFWTEKEAIENILAHSCEKKSPLFTVTGGASLLSGISPLDVLEGETSFDWITRHFSRGKGKGALALELLDGAGYLTIGIRAYAQIATSVTKVLPSGAGFTVTGAAAMGDAVDVDVIGDHRFVDGSLLLGDSQQYECDYNETAGENIQALATFSIPDNTISQGWKDPEATTFRDLPLTSRRDAKYHHIYQTYKIPIDHNGFVGDGLGNPGTSSFTYSCGDTGAIVTKEAAPHTHEIMADLPLYSGFTYTAAPVATGTGNIPETRLEPFFFFKNATKATPSKEIPASIITKISGDVIHVYRSEDDGFGSRYISDPAYTNKSLGTAYDFSLICFTLGIKLHARVRMASGASGMAQRKRKQFVAGAHLWLANENAVYGFGPDTSGSYPVLKNCGGGGGGVPGILRDDRDMLARRHWLSVIWYGPSSALNGDTLPKRNASWALRCCGDIPTSEDYDGGACVYPDVGQNVTTLTANGQKYSIRTPVSSVVYDNESGVTTWTTDWQDLDFQ